jgi:thioredoxin 1
MAKYIELTKNNFNEHNNNEITVIDFWASWCGPCRALAPIIEELSEEYFNSNVTIAKVNVDMEQELAQVFSIKSIPTIVFLKDGEIERTIVGLKSKESIKKYIEEILENK